MSTSTPARPDVDQVLFPRQHAAPPGPVDARMMYLMHFAFRRDLHVLTEAARATPPEDRTTWRALSRRWDLFATQLHHHHSGEDAGLWPLLLAHVPAEDHAVLDDMEAEHALIDPLLESVARGFAEVVDDPSVAAGLVEDLAAARDQLGQHLRHEEGGAMPLVQAHLSNEQWEEMAHEHFEKGQSPRDLLVLVPWALHQLPDADRQAVLDHAGAPFKVLQALGRPRFARMEARATRHLRDRA